MRGEIRQRIAAGTLPNLATLPKIGTIVAGLDRAACEHVLSTGNLNGADAESLLTQTGAAGTEKQADGAASVPGDVGQALKTLQAVFGGGLDVDKVNAAVDARVSSRVGDITAAMSKALEMVPAAIASIRAEALAAAPREIIVTLPDGERHEVGRQHFMFPMLLACCTARVHCYAVGPAGSGKTSVVHAIADALGLPFYSMSVCAQSSQSQLLGYNDASGTYQGTCFRQAFEHGGVFCLDEVDNGNANVLAVLNGALANTSMGFPDGMVKRHSDFVLVACANTFGTGADRLYVGRNQLDAATLDRFAFVDFPYDEGFEAHLCEVKGMGSPALDVSEGGTPRADEWVQFIQAVRAAFSKVYPRHVVSPRASIYGVRLAGAGIGRKHLEKMLVWKGLDAPVVEKVRAAMVK